MKLIECYINNFGKLTEKRYSFREGLNTVCEENGWGKSTLASFIKAMLFGLDDTKKTKLDENDRRKFDPWQGGAWGGSLTLSAGGKEYRIERSFSKKAGEDSCRIYNLATGKECFDFGSIEPGVMLFGIDRDGFERTVFLSEKNISDKCENKTISAKLSDLSGVAYDLSELDAAMKLLEDERKFYYKQGGGGAIGELSKKRSALEFKRAELERLQKKHDTDKELRDTLSREISVLKKQNESELSEERKKAIRRELFSEYRKRVQAYNEEKLRFERLSLFFKNGVPAREELYEAMRCEAEEKKLSSIIENDEAELNSNTNNDITENDIDRAALLASKIHEKEAQKNSLKLKKVNTGIKKHKIKTPLLIDGVFLTLIGIISGIFVTPLFSAAIIGVLMILLSLLKKKTDGELLKLEEEIKALDDEAKRESDELNAFLSRFGYDEKNAELAVSEIRRLVRGAKEKKKLLEENKALIKQYRDRYTAFTEKFPAAAHLPVSEIEERLAEYEKSLSAAKRLYGECLEMKEKYNFDGSEASETVALERQTAMLLEEKERELALLKNSYRLDELALEELDEIIAEAETLEETEIAYRERLFTVKRTKDFLESAKDNLNSRYLGKTKSAFEGYTALISKETGEFGIDTSFTLTKREGGYSKPKDAYSKGTRDLYSFALRLALIDSLYDKEKPFIMLDDPFAYFDDKKLSEATELIKKLAKERQIIYLTSTKTRLPT